MILLAARHAPYASCPYVRSEENATWVSGVTQDEVPFRRREETHLLLPDDLDLTSVEEVVSAFAPELKPVRWLWTDLLLAVLYQSLGIALGIVLFPQSLLGAVAAFLLVSSPGWFLLASGPRALRKYQRQLSETPGALFDKIASKFRREIEAHREKVLGPDSEWQQARAPLLEAKDEANRSAVYWRERMEHDATNEAARAQLRSADELEVKFTAALTELDHRSEALLQFFNECEAKLPVLERFRRDHEESLALEKLRERADDTVADAQSALALIGQQFVSEALRMGQALGALERFELKESAGFAPLDRIEHVADQILASSQEERESLGTLMEKMEG